MEEKTKEEKLLEELKKMEEEEKRKLKEIAQQKAFEEEENKIRVIINKEGGLTEQEETFLIDKFKEYFRSPMGKKDLKSSREYNALKQNGELQNRTDIKL